MTKVFQAKNKSLLFTTNLFLKLRELNLKSAPVSGFVYLSLHSVNNPWNEQSFRDYAAAKGLTEWPSQVTDHRVWCKLWTPLWHLQQSTHPQRKPRLIDLADVLCKHTNTLMDALPFTHQTQARTHTHNWRESESFRPGCSSQLQRNYRGIKSRLQSLVSFDSKPPTRIKLSPTGRQRTIRACCWSLSGPKRAEKPASYLSLLHVEMTGSTFGTRLREVHYFQMEMCPYFSGRGFRAGGGRRTHKGVLTHRWPALL